MGIDLYTIGNHKMSYQDPSSFFDKLQKKLNNKLYNLNSNSFFELYPASETSFEALKYNFDSEINEKCFKNLKYVFIDCNSKVCDRIKFAPNELFNIEEKQIPRFYRSMRLHFEYPNIDDENLLGWKENWDLYLDFCRRFCSLVEGNYLLYLNDGSFQDEICLFYDNVTIYEMIDSCISIAFPTFTKDEFIKNGKSTIVWLYEEGIV